MRGTGGIIIALLIVSVAIGLLMFSSPARAPSRQFGNRNIEYELLSNTDFCLTDCSLKFRFRLDRDYTITSPVQFSRKFVEMKGEVNLLDSGFRLGQTEKYSVPVWSPNIVCNPYNKIENGSVVKVENCADMGHYENQERERFVYRDFSPVGKTLKANEWHYMELWGRKGLKLGRDAIDAVPILGDFEFPFAIWDSYPYRYEIQSNATGIYALNVNDTFAPNVWTLNASPGERKYLYCVLSGCTDGNWSIGNATKETPWENASSQTGYNPTGIWGQDTVGLWHFDHVAGNNEEDSTQYGNDLSGSGAWNDSNAIFGNSFDATGNHNLNTSDNSYLSITDDITITAWVYPQFDSTQKFAVTKNRYPNDIAYSLRIGRGTSSEWSISNDGQSSGRTTLAFDDSYEIQKDSWWFVAVTYNGTDMAAYINGAFDESTTHSGGIADTNANLIIGGRDYTGEYYDFEGLIDEVRVYNRTLSSDEILEMYYNGINSLTSLGAEETANQTPVVSLYNISGSTADTTPGIDFNFTDDDQYATCHLLFNGTERGVNPSTPNAMRTTMNSNTTLEFNDYEVNVSCSDGMNMGISDSIILTIADTTPPTWSDNKTNATGSTASGEDVYFNITLGDDVAGGYYNFEFCDPACQNDTTESWTAGEEIREIKTISSIRGQTVSWRWFFNDSAGNSNSTPYWSITVANSPPTQSSPVLNSTSGKKLSTDNLTCWNISTADPDNDQVTNIYSWYRNGQPLASLSMPLETDGNDYSGNDNDGTTYGNPQFATGKYGRALQFDGSNDYILIPDSSSLDFTTEKSWEVWFRRDSTGTDQILFDKNNLSDKPNYRLAFDLSNKLVFSYYSDEEITYEDKAWTTATEADFNKGSYNQTHYNTTYSAVILDALESSGDYQSMVFNDSEETLQYQSLSWSADVPKLEELSPEAAMVALWHFNEGSGNTIYDETPNNNDGTIYGANWTSEGKFSYALSFDGSNDYADLGNTNSYTECDKSKGICFADTENFTLMIWYKGTDTAQGGSSVGKGLISWDNGGIYAGFILRNGYAEYVHYDSSWKHNINSTTLVADNNWHHIAYVNRNDETGDLYVDGVAERTGLSSSIDHASRYFQAKELMRGRSGDYTNGTMDEVAIWNRSLSASEVQEIYQKGIGAVTNLSFNVRSCNQSDCSDKGSTWDITEHTPPPVDLTSLSDNKYLQYKAFFTTNNTDYTPQLYNVTLAYKKPTTTEPGLRNITSTSSITDTSAWHLATVTFAPSGTNNLKLYINGTLDNQKTETTSPTQQDNDLYLGKRYPENDQFFQGYLDEFRIYSHALGPGQIYNHYNLGYNAVVSQETAGGDVYMCEVTPNDGFGDGVALNSTALTVLWSITFNITSGEDGSQLTNVNIYCNNSWSITGISSPYGHGFLPGTYSCTFEEKIRPYYNRTKVFSANNDKFVNVVMSLWGEMTIEEHTWLEKLYNCLYLGIDEDCYALKLLLNINETVTDIWKEFNRDDATVLLSENITNKNVSGDKNLTIDYSISVPAKRGYTAGEYLPIRISYWFLDENNETCYNQGDKPTGVESPYCQPLIIPTLGPMEGVTNFTVVLKPTLPEGNYNIVRRIDIDPDDVWINYGQSMIGQIHMLEANENPVAILQGVVRSADTITGMTIHEMLNPANISIIISLLTVGLVSYLVISRRKENNKLQYRYNKYNFLKKN